MPSPITKAWLGEPIRALMFGQRRDLIEESSRVWQVVFAVLARDRKDRDRGSQ